MNLDELTRMYNFAGADICRHGRPERAGRRDCLRAGRMRREYRHPRYQSRIKHQVVGTHG